MKSFYFTSFPKNNSICCEADGSALLLRKGRVPVVGAFSDDYRTTRFAVKMDANQMVSVMTVNRSRTPHAEDVIPALREVLRGVRPVRADVSFETTGVGVEYATCCVDGVKYSVCIDWDGKFSTRRMDSIPAAVLKRLLSFIPDNEPEWRKAARLA